MEEIKILYCIVLNERVTVVLSRHFICYPRYVFYTIDIHTVQQRY